MLPVSSPRFASSVAYSALAASITFLTACGGGGSEGSASATGLSEQTTSVSTVSVDEDRRELATALAATTTSYWNLKATLSSVTQVGQPYSQSNVASGGVQPYTYSLATGTLPAGVKLDAVTGIVSGTPTTAGAFSYSIRVTDAVRNTRRVDISGAIADGATSSAPSATAVQSDDVVYNFSAAKPESYKYATLQCQGRGNYFWQWGGQYGYYTNPLPSTIYGTDANGMSFDAFSTTASPDESGKSAFKWDLRVTDPDTAGTGAKRCEFAFGWKEYSYPGKVLTRQIGLPANKDIWWAVAVRHEDWSASASMNDWQILWQWHDGYGGGLPPFLTLQTKGNQWQIQLAYDMSTTPSNATLKKVTPWSATMPPNTWGRFVVKARKDLVNPANGYVQVWLNGTQIVNYHGPFGYNVTQMDYAKVGIYKWISAANAWNTNVPARRMWSKGPVQVNDRAGYTWESINALMD